MDHRSLHVFFFAVVIACVQTAAPPQDLQFPANEMPASRQRRLYKESKPYLNDSLSELQKPCRNCAVSKLARRIFPRCLLTLGKK